MRSLLALCLILVCFVDKSCGTFTEFMNNLPSEVANSFRSAWTSIADVIKKPVRIKRLGPGGKLKSSSTTTTTTTTTTPSAVTSQYQQYTKEKISTTTEYYGTTTINSGNKLTLPLLTTPKYRTLDEWRDMQRAYYAQRMTLDCGVEQGGKGKRDKRKWAHRQGSPGAPIVIVIDGTKKPQIIYEDEIIATQVSM